MITRPARFIAYIPDGPISRRTMAFDIAGNAKVSTLVDRIRAFWGHRKVLKGVDIYLFKCRELSINPEDTLPARASEWLRKRKPHDRMLEDVQLDFYFPGRPAPKEEQMIDIVISSPAVPESRDAFGWGASKPCEVEHRVSVSRAALRLLLDRRLLLEEMSSTLLPSYCTDSRSSSRMSFNKALGTDYHRSASAIRSQPTCLFSPIIARLKHRLEHLDQLEELEPDSLLLEHCHRVIDDAPEAYGCLSDEEHEHQSTLKLLLDELFEEYGYWQCHDYRGSGSAIWGRPAQVILVGDATLLQGVLTYVQHLSQCVNREYFDYSNCPLALLTITDTRLEISSLVFIDGVYVEKLLSEELCLSPWQSDNVLRLGRIMTALTHFFRESGEYRKSLKSDGKSPIAHLWPNPVPLKEGVSTPNLTYLGKLSYLGERMEMLQFGGNGPERAVGPCTRFIASMTFEGCKNGECSRNTEVVVKFTSRYNERAHRILAGKGFAPKLHFCEPVLGSLNMVVMDYVDGMRLWEAAGLPDAKRTAIFEDSKSAITLLHSENLVFGDLRIQNVIVRPQGSALLVDFDWAGVHDKDKYPATLNDEDRSTWAEGVGRRKIMKKEHDLFMLGEIKTFLDVP